MFSYGIAFLVLALAAGFLGFAVLAGTAALIARICLGIFLVLFILSLFRRGRTATSGV